MFISTATKSFTNCARRRLKYPSHGQRNATEQRAHEFSSAETNLEISPSFFSEPHGMPSAASLSCACVCMEMGIFIGVMMRSNAGDNTHRPTDRPTNHVQRFQMMRARFLCVFCGVSWSRETRCSNTCLWDLEAKLQILHRQRGSGGKKWNGNNKQSCILRRPFACHTSFTKHDNEQQCVCELNTMIRTKR